MAIKNVEIFEDLLRSDDGLQAKLRNMTETYGSNRQDDRLFFELVMAPMAREAGLPFTFDEAKAYAGSGRGLDDAELDAIAGGESYCLIIGKSDGDDTWACQVFDTGAGACDYIGVGLLWND